MRKEPDPNGPTQNKQRFGYAAPVEKEMPALANNAVSMVETDTIGQDWTALTPEERQAYGIRDDEVVGWARYPAVWRKEEGRDRGLQVMRAGGRVVLKDGMPITAGEDVMLVAYPKEVVEQREAEDTQKQQQLEHHLRYQDWPGQFDPTNEQQVREMRDQMLQQWKQLQESGWVSPTRGLPLTAVDEGMIPQESILLMEARARRGGRRPTPEEAEHERKLAQKLEEYEERASKRGTRFYSIPK